MLLRPGGLFPSKQRAAELQGDRDGQDPDLDENDSLYDVRSDNVPFQGRQS
jgi:hypothetical protein